MTPSSLAIRHRLTTAALLSLASASGCSARVGNSVDAGADVVTEADAESGTQADASNPALDPCLTELDESAATSVYFLELSPATRRSSASAQFMPDGFRRFQSPIPRNQCIEYAERGTTLLSAGAVTLSIGAQSWGTRVDSWGSYLVDLPPTMLGDVGLPVRFEATGGAIAAHSMELRVPPYVLVSLNGDRTSDRMQLSVSQPLVLDWQPVDAQVYLSVRGAPRALACIVDGRQGHLEVPAAVVADLGPTPSNVILYSGGLCRHSIRVGGQQIIGRATQGRGFVVITLVP